MTNANRSARRDISKRLAQKDQNTEEIWSYLEKLQQAGLIPIIGLWDDNSQNVYKIIAFVKNPESWEPYKAPKQCWSSDCLALVWWFDDEYTTLNKDNRLIYSEPNPESLNPEEKPQQPNIPKYESISIDDIAELIPEKFEGELINVIKNYLDNGSSSFDNARKI